MLSSKEEEGSRGIGEKPVVRAEFIPRRAFNVVDYSRAIGRYLNGKSCLNLNGERVWRQVWSLFDTLSQQLREVSKTSQQQKGFF